MRVALTSGAYQTSSVIASAQRCLNLYPETTKVEAHEPAPVTHYLTPGLRTVATAPSSVYRGAHVSTDGQLYVAVGNTLYSVSPAYAFYPILTFTTTSGQVRMADNGVDLAVVDGSKYGWFILLTTNVPTLISDPAFYGADRVDMLDGFFVFNRPSTNQFYLSDAIARTFDPLYIAAKAGFDRLVSLAVVRRELWLFGTLRTDIYNDVGAADFPLAAVSGGIEHGCAAAHSVAKTDGGIYWLSQSRDGRAVVMHGAAYQATRVSTHALETLWQTYATVSDAVANTYQLSGHIFYVLTFPSANATWVYDLATTEWHEWSSGASGRHRGAAHAAAFGHNLVGDYQTGDLYALDPATFTDAGVRTKRIRAFPHMILGAKRVRYVSFIADMECGTVAEGQPEPMVTLRYSDDRGASWSGSQTSTLGTNGQTLTSVQFQRLGMARDRVFELSWDAPVRTALQGAWVQAMASAT